jgi:hypothetical protein
MSKKLYGFALDHVEKAKAIKLLDVCSKDTDAASLVVLGPDMEHSTGCVLVLKGRQETEWLRAMLIHQRLLTPHKEITPGF